MTLTHVWCRGILRQVYIPIKTSMKRIDSMICRLNGLLLCLLLLQACTPTQKQGALFVHVNAPKNMSARNDAGVIRARFVKINFGLLERSVPAGNDTGSRIVFTVNLFDDAVYQAVLDRLDRNTPEGFVWIGHLDHVEYSQVTLVVEKDVLSGNITLPGSLYQIRYVGEGIHAVYRINQSAFPPEEPPLQAIMQ